MTTLSRRLSAIAGLITPGNRLADIGTDHGYIPVYSLEQGICPRALAMDVNEGPLERAHQHIEAAGLSDRIETRLSNGLQHLQPGEADTIVVAGMGGHTIMDILGAYPEVVASAKEIILGPQSDIPLVREFLRTHKLCIDAEDMVFEDGKYYQIIRCLPGEPKLAENPERQMLEDTYGPKLLDMRHPVLEEYLKREEDHIKDILCKLNNNPIRNSRRIEELKQELERNQKALDDKNP